MTLDEARALQDADIAYCAARQGITPEQERAERASLQELSHDYQPTHYQPTQEDLDGLYLTSAELAKLQRTGRI